MHLEVVEFIHPDLFAHYKEEGLKRGFSYVESGPLVRSSYHAERHI
jgi:lipoic acid synthetase